MGNIYTKKIMEFGILKTKIETRLLESYSNNTFKNIEAQAKFVFWKNLKTLN